MLMRIFHLQKKSVDIDILRSFYDSIVIPELEKIEGCLFAGLLQNNTNELEGISLTLWDTKENADAYEKSGLFEKLLDQAKPFLADSTEWKVQLSEDLELEYKPDGGEPDPEHFKVTVHEKVKDNLFSQHSKMFVRIISHILQKDKIDEFRDIYIEKIIPALRKTSGCRFAYLIESMDQENEVISLSIWDSEEHARVYENSGLFEKLVNELRPTFSQFFQWKMALEKKSGGKVSTSDDLKISDYRVLTGRNLRGSPSDHR